MTKLTLIALLALTTPADAQWQAPRTQGLPLTQRAVALPWFNGADRSRVELLNDNPYSDLAPLAEGVGIWGGQTVVKGALQWTPKATTKISILFSRPDPKFHILFPWGGPLFTTGCFWDDAHTTTRGIWFGLTLCPDKRNPPEVLLNWQNWLYDGDRTTVLIDSVSDGKPNKIWILAE